MSCDSESTTKIREPTRIDQRGWNAPVKLQAYTRTRDGFASRIGDATHDSADSAHEHVDVDLA